MLYVEVLLILLTALCLCFFIGKKLGERKIRRVEEGMKALELSLNQTLEQMELTMAHNLKVLDTKTEDLRQLLPIVDKKVLQAQDLTHELGELVNRKPQVNPASPLDPSRDLKFRHDIQEAIAAVQGCLSTLEQRLRTLEKSAAAPRSTPEPDMREVPRQTASRVVPIAEMPFSNAGSEKVVDIKSRELRREREREASSAAVSDLPPTLEAIVRQAEQQLQEVQRISQRAAAVAGDTRRLEPLFEPRSEPKNEPKVEADFPPLPTDLPEELTGEDVPAPGTLFYDVLALSQQGVTIPQIARKMNIGNGEVELIMKLYGSRFNLRKVM